MESNVRHGAMPGDAGGCQNYSGMLWGRGLVLSLSFLVGYCCSWGLQQDFQSSRSCSGVKTHLWPEEGLPQVGLCSYHWSQHPCAQLWSYHWIQGQCVLSQLNSVRRHKTEAIQLTSCRVCDSFNSSKD